MGLRVFEGEALYDYNLRHHNEALVRFQEGNPDLLVGEAWRDDPWKHIELG